MPAIRFTDLFEHFVSSLRHAGATVHVQAPANRPAGLSLITPHTIQDCSVYLWTITHGGHGRADNEQRIQLTGVSGIVVAAPRVTVIGGWSREHGVYAFWDARQHTGMTPGSPSLQVRAEVLAEAATLGMATEVRDVQQGREVIVVLKPEYVAWYIEHGYRTLHDAREDELANIMQGLVHATAHEEDAFVEGEEEEESRPRRREVVQSVRVYRDARFRHNVLAAYEYRCAVCSCSLRLVEAAHIIPVREPDGTDRVCNGIALCRLHHGAYDTALLGILPSYQLIVNDAEARRLRREDLDHGLVEFEADLPDEIAIPEVSAHRPTPGNLRRGLTVRGWPLELGI